MLQAILDFIGDGIGGVMDLFGDAMTGFVALVYDGSAITELGELLLMGAVVGMALFGIRFVRSMIPFVD
ncbi:MAG: hypothetical protein ACOCP4_03860 [Candidatus Woesearchaeota archaeon]|uniref:Uncharacterized protein n=1 Tax=Arfiviricetes sp. TaxID=2832556 RepID=A0AB39A3C0_9VIRU